MPGDMAPLRFSEKARPGTRLLMALPIVLSATDSARNSFSEDTHTLVINRTGAKVLTKRPFTLGARLQVSIPHRKLESGATVVWLGDKRGALQEIGIDLDQTDDFWGVRFPER